MKARLIRIGNSRGIRLPKPLLEKAGLTDEVELRAQAGTILISPPRPARPPRAPRAGWESEARALAARGGDKLLDPPTATRFDEEDWRWRSPRGRRNHLQP